MADEQGTDRPAGQPEDPPAGPGGPSEPGGLRRGLTHYGDAGFSMFLRKAFIKGAGYTDGALDRPCLLYTSDASDDLPCVNLGGRRSLKKKKQKEQQTAQLPDRRYHDHT